MPGIEIAITPGQVVAGIDVQPLLPSGRVVTREGDNLVTKLTNELVVTKNNEPIN